MRFHSIFFLAQQTFVDATTPQEESIETNPVRTFAVHYFNNGLLHIFSTTGSKFCVLNCYEISRIASVSLHLKNFFKKVFGSFEYTTVPVTFLAAASSICYYALLQLLPVAFSWKKNRNRHATIISVPTNLPDISAIWYHTAFDVLSSQNNSV